MKIIKQLTVMLLPFLLMGLLFTNCGDDGAAEEDVDYTVDVQIVSPNNNATMAVGEDFIVEVDYVRNENIIHNIKVEILDAAGNSVNKLVERHAHVANEFTFKSDAINLDQAGIYTIRASTTDLHTGDGEGNHGSGEGDGHDTDKNMVEHTITIQ